MGKRAPRREPVTALFVAERVAVAFAEDAEEEGADAEEGASEADAEWEAAALDEVAVGTALDEDEGTVEETGVDAADDAADDADSTAERAEACALWGHERRMCP